MSRIANSRISRISTLVLTAAAICVSSAAQSGSSNPGASSSVGVIHFAIRDSATGFAITDATLKWAQVGAPVPSTLPNSAISNSNGLLHLQLAAGEYGFEITAPGYKMMRTHSGLGPGASYPFNIFLDPVAPPRELDDQVVSSQLKDGFELVHGYVVDSNTHMPISGVSVRLQQSGAMTVTDSRGYFSLLTGAISSAEANGPADMPAPDSLVATLAGYQAYQLDGFLHEPGSESVIRIDLVRSKGGLGRERIEHGALLTAPRNAPATGVPINKNLNDWLSSPQTGIRLRKGLSRMSASAPTANLALPASIRVGSNCGTVQYGFGCTAVNSYSIETYVQDGLDKEWISGWNSESLKAGSVAYRSYGEYFAQHPICPTANGSSCPVAYDICNTTWCQAFNTTSQKSTVAAAKATSGVILTSDGVNAFFSEYAANTNGFSPCDGTVGQAGMPNYFPPAGSPGGPWPCMPDPVAAGSAGSGHGRGMSQWGSQWWARGQSYSGTSTPKRNWQCIVEHYYNNNGNLNGAAIQQRTSFIIGPGDDGPVAFISESSRGDSNVSTINIDGSLPVQLTRTGSTSHPVWQPGGAKISFQWLTTSSASYTMNPDGSGVTFLTNDYVWSWSPLADKYAAYQAVNQGGTQVFVANADATGRTQLTGMPNCGVYYCDNYSPIWSPDGSKIVFMSNRDDDPSNYYLAQVYVMNTDGTGQIALTHLGDNAAGTSGSGDPSWSPDGRMIVFDSGRTGLSQVFIMNADGTNVVQLTSSTSQNWGPSWSADGETIVFVSNRSGSSELFVMNPDGSNQTQLTHDYSDDFPNCRKCMRFDTL